MLFLGELSPCLLNTRPLHKYLYSTHNVIDKSCSRAFFNWHECLLSSMPSRSTGELKRHQCKQQEGDTQGPNRSDCRASATIMKRRSKTCRDGIVTKNKYDYNQVQDILSDCVFAPAMLKPPRTSAVWMQARKTRNDEYNFGRLRSCCTHSVSITSHSSSPGMLQNTAAFTI